MGRTMYQFAVQPILYPRSVFVFVINITLALLQQGFVYFAFSRRNQFELLIMADVAVFVGGVTIKLVDVLSDPKLSTAIDLLPCDAL